MSTSLFTFFEIQRSRVLNRLYPLGTNPPHALGPRRPDMQVQEYLSLRHPTFGPTIEGGVDLPDGE